MTYNNELPNDWSAKGRIYEILCPHGIGHSISDLTDKTTHGCDGCCSKEEFEEAKQAYLKHLKRRS